MQLNAIILSALLGFTTASPVQQSTAKAGVRTWDGWVRPVSAEPPAAPHLHVGRDPTLNHLVARDEVWVDSVNAYRSYAGIPTVRRDDDMVAGATRSMQESGGDLKHSLYNGALAQVIAGASNGDNGNDYTAFNNMFIGAWLCEVPTAVGLEGRCSFSPYNQWDHSNGEIEHYQIVTNGAYTRIGCAFGYNLWFCNFA